MGAAEVELFRAGHRALTQALAVTNEATPEDLGRLARRADPRLRNAVRSRIEGERTGLPGPALTPYLIGLLVMLGMLGTFLGMVLTLNGAAFSLEGSTDLQTMRSSLSAPIKGLGLAFGTSVAGVAASAMLGLISTLCRRERLRMAQLLDARIATVFRRFSLAHQREQAMRCSAPRPRPCRRGEPAAGDGGADRTPEPTAVRPHGGQSGEFHRDAKRSTPIWPTRWANP